MRPTTLLAAFVCLIGTLLPAAEGKRLAFVVGVDQYENLPPEAQLSVAVADAKRMKTTLESLDPPFTVRMVADGDVRGIEAAFDAFLDEAKGAECALVYFAGHGVEYHGANFLLVKDTAISDISADVERMKRRLATQAVSLQGWVDSLDATRAQVKVVILDCCRDNPLKAEDGSGTRSVVGGSRGLAQVTPPSGTLISYSADAGQRANDGLFTEVLANNLKTPGLNILKVFAKTREEVREISTAWAEEDATRGLAPDFRRSRHEPAEYNKLNLAGTDFAFTRGVPAAVKVDEPDPEMSEAEIERRAKEMAEKLVAEAMRKQPPTESTVTGNALTTPPTQPKPNAKGRPEPVSIPSLNPEREMNSSTSSSTEKVNSQIKAMPVSFLDGFGLNEREILLKTSILDADQSDETYWIIIGNEICILADTDGEGRADKLTRFADIESISGDRNTFWLAKTRESPVSMGLFSGQTKLAEFVDEDGDFRCDTVKHSTLTTATAFPADRGMEGSRAGEVRTFGGIEMVWCPPGEFLMGSPEDEEGRFDGETQHRVTLTRGFWMAKTECTQGQWESVIGENPSEFKGEDQPVETVSWDDVQGWLEKMNEQTPLPSGWEWALPTEAQWEYACRAGTETAFAGDLDEMAWYDENSGSRTNPVGTKKANAWGLYDMHGNVWEWCSDWYGDYSSASSSNPAGATTGDYRVSRGGSWGNGAQNCRSARRDGCATGVRLDSLGFRPALVPSIR